MSLNEGEIRQHCETILKSPRILNKIVLLCEGDIVREQRRLSPQLYRQMEKMPDSNFYKASIPRWWRQFLPQFFNCGDRSDVLNTYFTLLELHNANTSSSYLNPAKLFAIVDLDLQVKNTDSSYPFSNTEMIFRNLYKEAKINEDNILQHKIWVTGLMHKESYFLVPELQAVFDQFSAQLIYNDKKLLLEDIYLEMSNDICHDADLRSNFQRACDRISYCSELNFTELDSLRESWEVQFRSAQNFTRKNELVFILLTIRKAKGYWNKVQASKE